MRLKTALFFGAVAILLSLGCLKKEDFSGLTIKSASPTLAIPLLQTQFSSDQLVDLLDTLDVTVNAENVFTLNFFADPFVQQANSLIPVLDIGLPIPLFDSVLVVPLPVVNGFALQRASLDGKALLFFLNSSLAEDVEVTVRIPQLQLDGVSFQETYTIKSPPNQFISDSIQLAGYDLELQGGTFSVHYDARNSSGERIVLPLSFMQLTSFEFNYVEGNISTQIINTGLLTIDVALPDSLVEGEFEVLDPKIHFDLSNSFGVPAGARVKELYTLLEDGSRIDFESPLLAEIIPVGYPTLEEQGDTILQRITFDRNNSNIVELISDDLLTVFYDIDIVLNPSENPEEIFFIDESSIAILDATVELPLEVQIPQVVVRYGVPIRFDDFGDVGDARLKLIAENGIPLGFDPLLQFLTGGGDRQQLSADPSDVIAPASVNEFGEVVGKISSTLFFPLSSSEVQFITTSDSLMLEVLIMTGAEGMERARLQPGQELNVKVGAEIMLQ